MEDVIDRFKSFSLSEKQAYRLRNFNEEFEEFSDKYHEAFEFIGTKDWKDIQNQAREVLNCI